MVIRIGDLVRDSQHREGIVVKFDSPPDDDYLKFQKDKKMRDLIGNQHAVKWYKVYPLSGGSITTPESLTKRVRKATLKDFQIVYRNANYFGRENLIINVILE